MSNSADGQEGNQSSIERLIIQSMLRDLSQGLVFCQLDGTVLYWSSSAARITGLSSDAMVGQRCFVDEMESYYDDGNEIDVTNGPFQRCVDEATKIGSTVTIYRSGGRQVSADIQFIPVGNPPGPTIGVLIVLQDQSREAELKEQLLRLDTESKTDPLTSVANRGAFENHLSACLKNFRETQTPVSLAICDIDFFKRINDDYGHQIGDGALVHFAQHLKSNVRENDLVARYGGEEFVIVYSECDQENAKTITEKIRRSLEKTAIPILGGKSLTASFGISECHPDDTVESLFVRADQALLRAKEEGRNRVICSEIQGPLDVGGAQGADDDLEDWIDFAGPLLQQREFITPTPADVIATKIRGFVDEQQAKITGCSDTHLALAFGGQQSIFRRGGDQSLALLADIEMQFPETSGRGRQTALRISVRPKNSRDRRMELLTDAAGHLMKTICSYLMLGDDARLKPERAATKPGEGRQ